MSCVEYLCLALELKQHMQVTNICLQKVTYL
jgi:hypothetical protein